MGPMNRRVWYSTPISILVASVARRFIMSPEKLESGVLALKRNTFLYMRLEATVRIFIPIRQELK